MLDYDLAREEDYAARHLIELAPLPPPRVSYTGNSSVQPVLFSRLIPLQSATPVA